MSYPALKTLASEADYRTYFEATYCIGPLTTFDGIAVRFRKSDFDHCFFECSNRDGNKDTFSNPRTERIDWIKATLEDKTASIYVGWNKGRKLYDRTRRVCIVQGNYVVVIALIDATKAKFITAFVADSGRTLEMIKKSPEWK